MAPQAVTAVDPVDARRLALLLVESVARAEPALLELNAVELGGSLEQQLFFALRDGSDGGPPGLSHVLALGRAAAAGVLGVAGPLRRAPVEAGGALALVREPTHDAVLRGLADELTTLGVGLATVRTGRAAPAPAPSGPPSASLAAFVTPAAAARLWRMQAMLLARSANATAGWPAIAGDAAAERLRSVLVRELPRIALGAAALSGAVRAWRPRVLVAFDEIGTWARLLPAVARASGIPSLDLPHAEAADTAALRGAAYDRMAVYGPRAAQVLREASIGEERICQIGAPRFDPLVRVMADQPPRAERRRIVLAAQYETGRMTRALLDATRRAAFDVALAVGPSELVVVPHPAGAGEPLPEAAAGVAVRLGEAGLHAELPGAWLMVTGWSNSVFEAAIAGVPALTVSPPGVAPIDFAADGLAIAASDPASAAAAALRLLDPDAHRAAAEGARAALVSRLGPIDGGATRRAARLVQELIVGHPQSAT